MSTISRLIFIFLILICSGRLLGQNMSVKVTEVYEDKTLKFILDDLKEKYALRFSYASNKIPTRKLVSVSGEEISLYALLNKLFSPLSIEYRVIGGNIVLRNRSGDNAILVYGKVVDAEKEPIAYAHVSHVQGPTGVVTNNEGEFLFWIENASKYGSVKVSSIGFKTKTIPIQDIQGSEAEIVLQDTVITLDEVLISSRSAEEIVLKALENRSANLPSEPYVMNGFYRTAYKEGDEYVSLLEAALRIYDRDIFKRNGISLETKMMRKSNDYRKYKWDENSNYLSHFLLQTDLVRNEEGVLNKNILDHWNFEIDKTTYFEGNLIYKIVADLEEVQDDSTLFFNAVIYVREDDYAIFQVDYDYQWDPEHSQRRISKEVALKSTGVKVSSRYRNERDKMFLKYQTREGYFNIYERKSGEFLSTVTITDEFIVHEIEPGSIESNGGRIRRLGDIYNTTSSYEESFWENYNLPVDTELYKEIRSDLNKRQPLKEQFRQNGQ